MNKIRIIGLVVIAIGAIIQFTIAPKANGLISGLLFGFGIGLLITGKVAKPSF